MSLTLKLLQVEMRSSFENINERTDRILLKLDAHIKDTDSNFREVNRKLDKSTGDIIAGLSPYFATIEKMLSDHEIRITVLEKRR